MAELKSYFEKERPPCPFYGFGGTDTILMDSKGQCALRGLELISCGMEVGDEIPDWRECWYNKGEIGRKVFEGKMKARVFPNEFSPPEKKGWRGIPLKKWVDYVMNKTPIMEE